MKNFTFVLVFLIPLLALTQEPIPQIRKKAMTETIQGKTHIVQPLNKLEELQKEFFKNSISEKIKQLPSEENYLNNREIFPGRKVIDRLREKILKSAQNDSMLVDSLYIFTFRSPTDSVLMGKIYAIYNDKGYFGHVLRSELDTLTMKWHNTSKEDYFYDDKGRNISYIEYEWDINISDWLPVYKHEMEYNSDGRITISAYFNWDPVFNWVGQFKSERTWDEWGRQILYAFYSDWDVLTGTWIGYYKYEIAYDETGKQNLVIYYQWNHSANDWQGDSKQESTYDNFGNIILYVLSGWDEMNSRWIFQSRHEVAFGQDGTIQMAVYIWNKENEKWVGLGKSMFYTINESEQHSISYSWNSKEESWEESGKEVSKQLNDGLSFQRKTFIKQDSIIPGILINGFDTQDDISITATDVSCPEQTCTVLDSDFVEGTASIRWDYHVSGKATYWGGVCQFVILNSKDLSGFDGISMDYKVLAPSFAWFVVVIRESSGEIWDYTSYEMPRDTSDHWKVFTVPFNELSNRNFIEGYLNRGNIEKITIQVFTDQNTENSGTILLDNLSACYITKAKLWIPESFTEEIYDEKNNLISLTESSWDPFLQDYYDTYKFKNEIEYDKEGKLVSRLTYDWNISMDAEDWRNVAKHILEYDNNGNLIGSEFYYRDDLSNELIGENKYISSFDEDGNQLFYIYYSWDYEAKNWIPANKEESTFISGNIQASHAFYTWDIDKNNWIGLYKYETFFNQAMEEIKVIYYEWDMNAFDWKVENYYWIGHYTDQYDAEGRLQAFVYETWEETLNQWSPKEKYYYFYSLHSITTGIPEVLTQISFVKVYPNPATDYIWVITLSGTENGTINMYNYSGQKVKTLKTVGDVTNINVNDLPSGNYLLQYVTGKDAIVEKIVIR